MRLRRALHEYFVGGIKTNISLFRRILLDPDFRAGKVRYRISRPLVGEGQRTEQKVESSRAQIAAIAAGLFAVLDPATSADQERKRCRGGCCLQVETERAVGSAALIDLYDLRSHSGRQAASARTGKSRGLCGNAVWTGARWWWTRWCRVADVLSLLVDGQAYEIKREQTAADLHMWVGSERFSVELRDPRSLRSRGTAPGMPKGPQKLMAPMPGKIVRILVAEKSEVEAGQGIVVVEAMKMQNEIKSPKKGIVQKILVAEGDKVNAGDGLAIVE